MLLPVRPDDRLAARIAAARAPHHRVAVGGAPDDGVAVARAPDDRIAVGARAPDDGVAVAGAPHAAGRRAYHAPRDRLTRDRCGSPERADLPGVCVGRDLIVVDAVRAPEDL